MPFTCNTVSAVLLLHHQSNPISKKKTKKSTSNENQTLPKNQKVIKPRTPRGFFYVLKYAVIPAENCLTAYILTGIIFSLIQLFRKRVQYVSVFKPGTTLHFYPVNQIVHP